MDVPHPELHAALRGNDNVIAVNVIVYLLVEVDILHDSVNESRREGRLASVMYVAFEIGRKPERYI